MSGQVDEPQALTKKDFVSGRRCVGAQGAGTMQFCYLQKLFPELGIPRENFVVVSGIGCSSRFPYYMNTYGASYHSRACTVCEATGIKSSNPDLSVWVITGDGDGLSIGGNHLMHILRRNLDVNILLFNNRIYGLTKGQYSPTSEQGKKTKHLQWVQLSILSIPYVSSAGFLKQHLLLEPLILILNICCCRYGGYS